MKEKLAKDESENIINKIIKNILIFINSNSGYLNDLVEIMRILPIKFYFEIVVIIIDKLIELGKNCLKERNNLALTYFEKAYLFLKKYAIKGNLRNQLPLINDYIKAINENKFPINESFLKSKPFIISNITGYALNPFLLRINEKDQEEKYNIILNNYENILIELSDKICKEKAICITNILIVSIKYLGNNNYRKYYKLGKDCEFIVAYLKLDRNEYWYKEFNETFQDIIPHSNRIEENENIERIRIKKEYKEIFEEIELQFVMRKDNIDFIKYILY